MTDVYVMYNEGRLRTVYAHRTHAELDKQRLIDKGYKNVRVQRVQVQTQSRVDEPLSIEHIEALKKCVERS